MKNTNVYISAIFSNISLQYIFKKYYVPSFLAIALEVRVGLQ